MTAWVWRGIGARCFQPHHVDAPPSIEPETSLCCLHHHLNCCTRRPIESTLPSWSGAGRTGGRSLARASPLAAGEPASATLPLQAQLAVALPQIQFASVAEMPRKGASLLSTAAQPSQSPADGVANSRSCASTTPSSTRSASTRTPKCTRPHACCRSALLQHVIRPRLQEGRFAPALQRGGMCSSRAHDVLHMGTRFSLSKA
jgi:hypothetical protein